MGFREVKKSIVNKAGGDAVCFWNGSRCFPSAKMTNRNVVCGNTQPFPGVLLMCKNKKGLARIPWTVHSTLFRQILASQSCLECGMYEKKCACLTWCKEKVRQDLFSSTFSLQSVHNYIFPRWDMRIFLMTHWRIHLFEKNVAVSKLKDFYWSFRLNLKTI